jgi:hypothetical protein
VARAVGAMPLQLKRTREMLASGAYRAPQPPPRDEPTPSTSEGPDLAPKDAPSEDLPRKETVAAQEKDAVVVAETVDASAPAKATIDTCQLDTTRVSNDPAHAWFTHLPGTSPVAFAEANPPTAVCPMTWPWVYARCLGVRLPPAPPAHEGNFSGKWMLMSVPNETLDKRWVQACVAVEAGEVSAAKVVPGGGAMGGSPVIAYTNDFRDAEDVLRAGLALRARFGDKAAVKLLYKPDVFTLCDPERLFETGPRGGKRPIPKCPYQLLPGAFELKVVSKSLTLAKEMAVEPWARRMGAEDDEKPTGTGTEDAPIEL